MKTTVKFCGLRDPEAVKLVPSGGVAGFVVNVPASPRNLAIDRVAELVDAVSSDAEAWAVVVDPTAEQIHQLFDGAGVDRIQVYGKIPTELEFLEVHHLVPSLPIPPPGSSEPDPAIPPAEDYSRLHLDAAGGVLPGGSGIRADWERCARIVDSQPGRKIMLGGGLTPGNVGEALGQVHPWGVDVSSGVERSPGEKDLELMRAFLSAVEKFESSHA